MQTIDERPTTGFSYHNADNTTGDPNDNRKAIGTRKIENRFGADEDAWSDDTGQKKIDGVHEAHSRLMRDSPCGQRGHSWCMITTWWSHLKENELANEWMWKCPRFKLAWQCKHGVHACSLLSFVCSSSFLILFEILFVYPRNKWEECYHGTRKIRQIISARKPHNLPLFSGNRKITKQLDWKAIDGK